MKSQKVKDLYYLSVGKLSIFSWMWHSLLRAKKYKDSYLNIGCGTNYVPGMVNIDGYVLRKKDIWLDVTIGLPFPAGSIRGIYISHILEHLPLARVRRLLREFHRVLKPGGVVRIIVPSLEYAINAYNTNASSNLPTWPDKFQSIGGKFYNFMLCANQHAIMFDFSFLEELLKAAGFKTVLREKARSSSLFSAEHMQFETKNTERDVSLYVECIK